MKALPKRWQSAVFFTEVQTSDASLRQNKSAERGAAM
jgi:hypothetical protein